MKGSDLILECPGHPNHDMKISGEWDFEGDLLISKRGKSNLWEKGSLYFDRNEVMEIYKHLHKMLFEESNQ